VARYYVMVDSDDVDGIVQLSVCFPDLEGARYYKKISSSTYKGRRLYVMKEIGDEE